MLAVSVYVCLPLCENVLSTSLHITIQTIYSVLEGLSLLFIFGVFLLYLIIIFFEYTFEYTKLVTAHQKQKKRNSTTMLFCFSIQCFSEVYTCVLHCCTVPCVFTVWHTHTDTQELLNKSKWMCSFHISCTLKLHGNHNNFNKLLQKNVLLIKLYKLFYVHYLSSTSFGY